MAKSNKNIKKPDCEEKVKKSFKAGMMIGQNMKKSSIKKK